MAKVLVPKTSPKIERVLLTEDELLNLTEGQFLEHLKSQWWRLNHLYWIQSETEDEDGNIVTRRVKYRFTDIQKAIYDNSWYWNIHLKSRQHGITTYYGILQLDTVMWNSEQTCVIIAHTDKAAKKIFATKVRYPYDNLPERIRNSIQTKVENKGELAFDNNSSISVTTSARSDTCQMQHVSELGPICAKNPLKAQEIISGGFNAVHPGSMLSIESTAMGRSGAFFDFCMEAQKAKIKREKLSKLAFRFHFAAWWENKRNVIDPDGIVIHQFMQDYFANLKDKYGIHLSDEQKAWYIERQKKDPDNIKSEQPSTPDEAFEVSIVGAYFKSQFTDVYEQGRICSVPHTKSTLVDTWWDIGMNDYMAIWFTQTVGREIHLINYFENCGETFTYYKKILDEYSQKYGYSYGKHTAPHDIAVREVGSTSLAGSARFVSAQEVGIYFQAAGKIKKEIEGITASRSIFPICYFDEVNCAEAIVHLELFRKDWDELRGQFKDTALRNEHKHCADAFMTMAISHPLSQFIIHKAQKKLPRGPKRTAAGWT